MSRSIYQQVNLYHPIFRRQKQIFSSTTLVHVLGVFTIALLTIYFYGLWQVRALEAEAIQIEGREKAYAAQLAGLDAGSGLARRREVEDELRRLGAKLIEQQRLIDVLAEQPLGRVEGFSEQLAALARRHRTGLWLTDLTINGASDAIELVGRSISPELVPAYLLTLGEEPALSGRRFDEFSLVRIEDGTGIVFRVASRAASADSTERVADGRR